MKNYQIYRVNVDMPDYNTCLVSLIGHELSHGLVVNGSIDRHCYRLGYHWLNHRFQATDLPVGNGDGLAEQHPSLWLDALASTIEIIDTLPRIISKH
jgi:hypothetical protein